MKKFNNNIKNNSPSFAIDRDEFLNLKPSKFLFKFNSSLKLQLQRSRRALPTARSLFCLILLFCFSLSTPPVIAQIHLTQGRQLIQQGKQHYNLEQFTEAIPIWQQAIETLPHNSLNQAIALSNLSLTYQQRGNWEKAQETITKSLTILQSLKNTTEQQRILAQTLEIQGRLFHKTGQSQEALNIWQKAATIHPNLVEKKINQINQAQAMQDLGLYPKACQTLLKTLDLDNKECYISQSEIALIQSEILNNPHNHYKIKALRSLGNVLRVIGDSQQSQKVLQASLKIVQQRNSPQEESKTLLNLGNTERALATRAEEINDIEQLKIHQKQALNYYQKAVNLSSSSLLKIQAKLNQIELLLNQENGNQAEQLFINQENGNQAEQLFINQENGNQAEQLFINQENGNKTEQLFINQDNWEKAEQLLLQISDSIANLPLNRQRIYAQINYTKNLLCLQQKEANCLNPQKPNLSSVDEQTFQKATQILENAAQDAANIQDKHTQSYIEGIIGRLYESRQAWTKAEQYTEIALHDSWQAQASELSYQWQWQQGRLFKAQGKRQKALQAYKQAITTLKSLRSDLVSINPEIQFTFRESIEPVYREYVSLILQPQDNIPTPPENLQLARETIDSLQLAELENFFRLVCLDANPVVIDQVTDEKDPTAAVLYPILLDDRFEIILKLPQQPLRHYTTPINNKKEVERILARLTQSLAQANSQETLPLAQLVYDWLLRPAQEDLAQSQIKTLVFVLDSALRNIPMSVLHDSKEYLIEKYSVALIPSLQLLEPQPLKQRESNILLAGLSEARGNFPSLPFVPEEIELIQEQFPRSTSLFNQAFTNEGFEDTVNSAPFSVVHLATHGQFSSQAEETFVLTWDDRLNVNQLNNLIRSRNSEPIELLVLSACETLTGDKRASLGLAGVAVRAGVRSTLATLWQVNDQTTAILMNQFYATFKNSTVTKANALRQAQLKLLNDPIYKPPHFWAAYVLVGNWL